MRHFQYLKDEKYLKYLYFDFILFDAYRFHLYLEHFYLHCPNLSPLYQDNTADITLIKANKIASRLYHINITLYYIHNKYKL